jgi:hypothetical protein
MPYRIIPVITGVAAGLLSTVAASEWTALRRGTTR